MDAQESKSQTVCKRAAAERQTALGARRAQLLRNAVSSFLDTHKFGPESALSFGEIANLERALRKLQGS